MAQRRTGRDTQVQAFSLAVSKEELAQAQAATAITTKEELHAFHRRSGIGYLVFKASDLVDALWGTPGLDQLQLILDAYRQQRHQQFLHKEPDGEEVYKSEFLEPDEIEECHRMLKAHFDEYAKGRAEARAQKGRTR